MKFSEAVIKGYCDPRIEGRQWIKNFADDEVNPTQVCCLGAANIALTGTPFVNNQLLPQWVLWRDQFWNRVGVNPADLNDEGMDWRDIVGIAIAEGL